MRTHVHVCALFMSNYFVVASKARVRTYSSYARLKRAHLSKLGLRPFWGASPNNSLNYGLCPLLGAGQSPLLCLQQALLIVGA